MLREIVGHALAAAPGMTIAGETAGALPDIATLAIAVRADVIVFPSAVSTTIVDDALTLLRTSPVLALVEMDGPGNRTILHHLVPVQEEVGRLSLPALTAAIQGAVKSAGAAREDRTRPVAWRGGATAATRPPAALSGVAFADRGAWFAWPAASPPEGPGLKALITAWVEPRTLAAVRATDRAAAASIARPGGYRDGLGGVSAGPVPPAVSAAAD